MTVFNRGIPVLWVVTLAGITGASAADLAKDKPVLKAKPAAEKPFFLINDNRVTYSYYGSAAVPGYTRNASTNTLAFTHFDAWAYGTNTVSILYSKYDHAVPTPPCVGNLAGPAGPCAGGAVGLFSVRSTLGWNELFDTKAFSVGPLTNISFLAGASMAPFNLLTATSGSGVIAGLQFGFALPYKGYFNIAPVYSQDWGYTNNALPSGTDGAIGVKPPFTGLPDGVQRFNPTWGIETNYYMDLGFLPESLQYFSISGRASIRGPKGNGYYGPYVGDPLKSRTVEYVTEPIRVTLDAGKLFWGPQYSHLVDIWTAWRYNRNTAGYAVAYDPTCAPGGVYNGSCSDSGVYSGITVKRGAEVPGTPALSAFGLPFFKDVDNRLTYAYLPDATSPGQTANTAKQVFAYAHNDAWSYGTNSFYADVMRSDHRDPSSPCSAAYGTPVFGASGPCAGTYEFNASLRSTLGWNEAFGTRAFTVGPLKNISFEAGADLRIANNFMSPEKKAVVAGLQFAFDLPYRGYLNIAPLYYQEWNHNTFAYPNYAGFALLGNPPYAGLLPAGLTGTPDGNLHFNPTWAVEVNYGMDLGFLPESLRFFSVSGRAGFYGPKGNGAYGGYTLPSAMSTKTEINSEPVRLTFDASKALWGAKYAHFVDAWVAYRYWRNKFGFDGSNPANSICFFADGTSNRSCTEQTVYSGITVKV